LGCDNIFAKCGCLSEAKSVFENMGVKDLASWAAMIGGAVHGADWIEVMNFLNRMRSQGFYTRSCDFRYYYSAMWQGEGAGDWNGIAWNFSQNAELVMISVFLMLWLICIANVPHNLNLTISLFQSISYKDVIS
jgi:hypothetical protein